MSPPFLCHFQVPVLWLDSVLEVFDLKVVAAGQNLDWVLGSQHCGGLSSQPGLSITSSPSNMVFQGVRSMPSSGMYPRSPGSLWLVSCYAALVSDWSRGGSAVCCHCLPGETLYTCNSSPAVPWSPTGAPWSMRNPQPFLLFHSAQCHWVATVTRNSYSQLQNQSSFLLSFFIVWPCFHLANCKEYANTPSSQHFLKSYLDSFCLTAWKN